MTSCAIESILALLLITGCGKRLPDGLSEIEKATFTINNYGRCGAGVFVGCPEDNKERVYLLTARHVATYPGVAETELDLRLGSGKCIRIKAAHSRWYTSWKNQDTAWFELDADEKRELMEKEAHCYISLLPTLLSQSGAMICGTCTIPFERYAADHRDEEPAAKVFHRESMMDAKLELSKMLVARMPFDSNKVLKMSNIQIVPAKCTQLAVPGDSGSAAFMQTNVDGVECWALIGLVIGGHANHRVDAIQPLDSTISDIRYSTRKLSDSPELW